MFKLILLVTLSLFLRDAMSEDCGQISTMALLDMDKFSGAWYGVQTVHNIPVCEIFKIKPGNHPYSFGLTTETRTTTSDSHYNTKCTETLEAIDIDKPGRMKITPLPRAIGIVPYKSCQAVESNFMVVKTDYDTYAVITRSDGLVYNSISEQKNSYMCSTSTQIWSRTPALSENFIHKINNIRNEFGDLDRLLFNFDALRNKTGCAASREERIVEVDIIES